MSSSSCPLGGATGQLPPKTVSSQLLINIVNSEHWGGSSMAFVFCVLDVYLSLCLNGGACTSWTDSKLHQFGCEVINNQSIELLDVRAHVLLTSAAWGSGVHLPFQSQCGLKSELWSQLIKWRNNTPTWPHREGRAGLKASLLNQKWL